MKWRNINNGYSARLDELRALNPYELLGVPEDASMAEVKRAYRAKVKAYHPDRTDSFMKEYGQEVVKLLNVAMKIIERERSNEAR